jgi:hypothetical protein
LKAAVFLLCLCASAAAADPLSLEPVQTWVDSFTRPGATPIPGRFHPVQSENEPEPRYYVFEPEPGVAVGKLRYRNASSPQIEWGRNRYEMERLATTWGYPLGGQAWDWSGIRVYRLAMKNRRFVCLESAFSGLGQSGSMALESAVLVLEAGQRAERLYFAGFGATCRMVGDVAGRGRLGFVQLQRYDGGEKARASVNLVEGRGKVKTVRTYELHGIESAAGHSLRVEPLPLAEPARTPQP